jgi:TM2 domain-containing membrane protein YozV
MLELLLAAASLAWLLGLLASSVGLIRAQTPQEHDAAMRILTGCIIGGIITVIAPSIGTWITGLKTYTLKAPYGDLEPGTYYYTGTTITSPEDLKAAVDAGRCLPSGTGQVIDKVISLLRIVGGLVVVAGLLWGGISLAGERRPESPPAEVEKPKSPAEKKPKEGLGEKLVKYRSPEMAAILAGLLGAFGAMGVGHLYVGRLRRGLAIFAAGVLCIASWLCGFVVANPLMLLGGIAGFCLWLWQIFDAYGLAKRYSDFVREHGKAPW